MSVAVAGGAVARSRTIHMTESAPVALQYAGYFRNSAAGLGSTLDDLTDIISGAVLVGNADEVLVPASLAVAVQSYCDRMDPNARLACAEAYTDWRTMIETQKVRLLVTPEEVDAVLSQWPCFRRFCVAVPGGPLVSQLAFHTSVDTFYRETLPALRHRLAQEAASAQGPVSWQAWVRSALTCRYEGMFVPPIRVSEYTAALLSPSTDGGADSVVWEEGVCGLTPRWLETALKTCMACGVSTSALSLALCARPPKEPQLLTAKAIDMGVSMFCTSSAPQNGLFAATDPLIPLNDVNRFAVAWNQTVDSEDAYQRSQSSDNDVEEQLSACDSYVQSLMDRFPPVARDSPTGPPHIS